MSEIKKTKFLVIGSGPAGYTAAIYAARGALDPILVSGTQPGGQLMVTTDVENYPGFADVIQGPWLMQQMEQQAKNVGVTVVHDHIKAVEKKGDIFLATAESGTIYEAECISICTGAQAKWLGLESEKKYQGFGVSGCATCDAFFYKNKEVMVVGGGNTAVEEALYLTSHASKITLIHRRDSLRAEQVLQKRLLEHPKITVLWDTVLEEVLGDENPLSVTGAKIRNVKTGEIKDIDVDGIFIAIGHFPNTKLFKDLVEMDEEGYIITKPGTPITSVPGVYAGGDVQDKIYRQAVTAAGTGCMCALEAIKFLSEK